MEIKRYGEKDTEVVALDNVSFCQQTNFISVKMRYIYGVSAGLK